MLVGRGRRGQIALVSALGPQSLYLLEELRGVCRNLTKPALHLACFSAETAVLCKRDWSSTGVHSLPLIPQFSLGVQSSWPPLLVWGSSSLLFKETKAQSREATCLRPGPPDLVVQVFPYLGMCGR